MIPKREPPPLRKQKQTNLPSLKDSSDILQVGKAAQKYKTMNFDISRGLYLYYPKNTYNAGMFYTLRTFDSVMELIQLTKKTRRKQGVRSCCYYLHKLNRGKYSQSYLLVFLPIKTLAFELDNVRTILNWAIDTFGLSPLRVDNIPEMRKLIPAYDKMLDELKTLGRRKLSPKSQQLYVFIKNHLDYLKRKGN